MISTFIHRWGFLAAEDPGEKLGEGIDLNLHQTGKAMIFKTMFDRNAQGSLRLALFNYAGVIIQS